ncbi:MAG: sodium:calcium symporter, partial [Acidobacteriota bacterium]
TPDPVNAPESSVLVGLNYLWNPDFAKLGPGAVWLAAAGQVFFTLSIGTGCIETYASYLRSKNDVLLTGLTTSMTNEFSEVILGGSIAIPVAVAYFGLPGTQAIAEGGSFNLGFMAMPIIFQKLPLGDFFGFMWFALLFFAGITSSVALSQPTMAFLQEEFGLSRRKAAFLLGFIILLASQPIILFLGHGYLDEIDFWIGTFGLVAFALIEVVIFILFFGMDNAWEEMHRGAQIRLPRVYYYIIKYVTPLYLVVIFAAWGWQKGIPTLLMEGQSSENVPYLWLARAFILGTVGASMLLVWLSWKRRRARGEEAP